MKSYPFQTILESAFYTYLQNCCQMYIIDQNLLWASISNKSDWAGKPQITLGANNGAGSSITRSLPALPCQHFLWALIKSDQHFDFVSNFIRSLHWNHVRKHKRNKIMEQQTHNNILLRGNTQPLKMFSDVRHSDILSSWTSIYACLF